MPPVPKTHREVPATSVSVLTVITREDIVKLNHLGVFKTAAKMAASASISLPAFCVNVQAPSVDFVVKILLG